MSGAKPRGFWGITPTRLKDDSWDLHKSDEIFVSLGGVYCTPVFQDGIRHHTAEHSDDNVQTKLWPSNCSDIALAGEL